MPARARAKKNAGACRVCGLPALVRNDVSRLLPESYFPTPTFDSCMVLSALKPSPQVLVPPLEGLNTSFDFATCATWFATAACALLFVVLCDSAVGALLVLGCDAVAEVCGAGWRPLSVASASFTFTETFCPPMFPLITLPDGCAAVVLLEPE